MTRLEQISDAALELFAERGYHGTGMEHIAARVGMAASSLYNHCSGKQDLLADITIGTVTELIAAFDEAVPAAFAEDPRLRLAEAMRFHIHFHTRRAAAVRVVNQEVNALDPEPREKVRSLRREYVRRWISIIDSGTAAGWFRVTDKKIITYALIDMGIGVAAWFTPEGRYGVDELAIIYARAALRMVGSTDIEATIAELKTRKMPEGAPASRRDSEGQ